MADSKKLTRRMRQLPRRKVASGPGNGGELRARPASGAEMVGERQSASQLTVGNSVLAMPVVRTFASRDAPVRTRPRIALAMAGGGPLGAIYEIGALTAIDESLDGIDLNALDMYVGVSAGGILGAGLANGITPREMCRMFIESEESPTPFDPRILMQPAFAEYWQRMRRIPPLLLRSVWHYATRVGRRGGKSFYDSFEPLTRAIPTGIFSNHGLERFLLDMFSQPGRTNDFRALAARLYLIATDLDSGQSIEFGAPGFDDVPISLAATASSALPGLFPPVEIRGRHFLDGALRRTLHASIALKEGADLVLCLNPIVPYDDGAVAAAGGVPRHLVDGGLPIVLSQTIRAVIHSRMEIGMRQYAEDFKGADVLLFEPNRADADMFFTNMFSYSSRRRLCEHAYQKTRAELWRRRHELQPLLARHGVALNLNVLRDKSRVLVRSAFSRPTRPVLPMTGITGRLEDSLADLERYVVHVRSGGMAV